MSAWKQFPFIRLTSALVCGIIPGFLFETVSPGLFTTGIIYIFTCVFIFLPGKMISYRYRWIQGLMIFLFLFISGWMLAASEMAGREAVQGIDGRKAMYIAEICEPVVQKARTTKVILQLVAEKKDSVWEKRRGKVQAYIRKDISSGMLYYGDRIVIRSELSEPQGEMNPGGFNSRRFLRYKGIFLQGFIGNEEWRLIGNETQNPVFSFSLHLRDRLLEIFRENGLTGQEFAVASALLLGYVDEIDQEVMQDYSITGAMHILSVSGMHVGVIFIFIEKMLSFLNRSRRGILIKSGLSIVFIWIYALLTGMSPAVMRAAAMITLVIIGNTSRRHPDILNVLSVSMFFLLVWDPGLLFNTGFLLSYMAVAGIVILYKPIEDLWIPKNGIVGKIWSLIAVSLAAQLATFPLCIYYFHQFPNYFLLTNLAVVPFSNLVIYAGIVCLAFGKVPLVSGILAYILMLFVRIMNSSLHFIGALPGSATTGIFISFPEMIILYGTMTLMISYFFIGKKRLFFSSLVCLVFFSGSMFIRKYEHISQCGIIIYSVRTSFLADLYDGRKAILTGDLRALDDPYFHQTYIKNHQSMDLSNCLELRTDPGKSYSAFQFSGKFTRTSHIIEFAGKRAGLIWEKVPAYFGPRLRTDLVIISKNPYLKLKDILKIYDTKMIVIDGSNSFTRTSRWLHEADSLKIPCHSLKRKGAFIIHF